MARRLKNPRQILWTLLLTLVATVIAVPMHSQSTTAGSDSEPKSAASPGLPAPQPVVAAKAEDSPALTPEQQRQARIEADTKKLYQLSAELRAEVAKTYKESLSLTVLRKAQEVETLAKSLKVLMSQEAAARR